MKRWMTLAWLVFGLAFGSALHAADKPMNVVLILADDLGWTDLKCFGSELYETPNLDKLAAQGMKFTQNYSACTVCSPTRSAIMTGKYPARTHITDWIPGRMPENPKLIVPEWTKELPLAETTIAEVFKHLGYATASIGKWHLGEQDFYPEKQGFDVNIAGMNLGAPPSYFAPYGLATLADGPKGEYLTDRLGEEAAKWIRSKANVPFFAYLPHHAVHTPVQGKPEISAKYRAKLKPEMEQKNPDYAAMVESMDAAVGRVLDTLEELKIADRTLVIFTSDNGGRIPTTANRPLRVGKGSAYEGGVRVPLIVKWPGVTKPGSACDVPVISMDLFATILDICGKADAASKPPFAATATGFSGRDGVSLVPLLKQTGTISRSELFWHYPHHQHYQQGGTMPYAAIRSGDYKLIEFYNDKHVELYNIAKDIGEKNDLAAAEPETARRLRERLHAWQAEIGAQFATPNPHFDSGKPEYAPPAPKPAKKGKGKNK